MIDQGLTWIGNTSVGKFCKDYLAPALRIGRTVLSLCGLLIVKLLSAIGNICKSSSLAALNSYIPNPIKDFVV